MEMVGGNGRNEQQNETIINKPMDSIPTTQPSNE